MSSFFSFFFVNTIQPLSRPVMEQHHQAEMQITSEPPLRSTFNRSSCTRAASTVAGRRLNWETSSCECGSTTRGVHAQQKPFLHKWLLEHNCSTYGASVDCLPAEYFMLCDAAPIISTVQIKFQGNDSVEVLARVLRHIFSRHTGGPVVQGPTEIWSQAQCCMTRAYWLNCAKL